MLEVLDWFLKVLLLFCSTVHLYNSIIKLKNGNKAFQYYFYLLFYFFYILPIILKFMFPTHQYISFYRANEAMADPLANIIYDVFVISFCTVIMNSGKRNDYITSHELTYNVVLIRFCTIVIIIAFSFSIATSGWQSILSYGYAYLSETINVNENIIGCGVISYLVLLGHKKYISKIHLLIVTILTIGCILIVGKRYVIAETVIMSIYVLSMVGEIDGKKLFKYLISGVIAVIAFCVIYGIALKGNFNSFVDYFLVDMSRQYTLVYQFFCETIGKNISVGNFDAILWLITWWVPRTIWSNKPYPFVNQLTYSLISSSNTPSGLNVGWATTCSIFSDLFDSFSYFGLIFGFTLFTWLFKRTNNTRKPHFKILLMYLTVRLLTVQISSAIFQIVICFGIFFICDKIGNNYQVKRSEH